MSTTSLDRLQAALVELTPAQAIAADALAAGSTHAEAAGGRRDRSMTMPATDTDELAAILIAALAETGRSIDDLTVTEAIDLAEGLRGFVAVLPTPSAVDVRIATALIAAADLIEQRAGTG